MHPTIAGRTSFQLRDERAMQRRGLKPTAASADRKSVRVRSAHTADLCAHKLAHFESCG
jgi:hypothetical protein